MSRIVVGVDGSPGANRALAWAVDEARRRAVSVHAFTAWSYPALATLPLEAPTLDEFRRAAYSALGTSVAHVEPDGVEMSCRVVQGRPTEVLLAAADADDLLVVGRRGLGGFERLLLGSVSRSLLHRTHVPTVIVPDEPVGGTGVIAGLDLTETDDTVLAAAVAEAARRGVGCTALHAVEPGFAFVGDGVPWPDLADALVEASDQRLRTAITSVAGADVHLGGRTVVASAVGALVEASRDAELVVVGRRSHLILGSVADGAAAHAHCPVLVVPQG